MIYLRHFSLLKESEVDKDAFKKLRKNMHNLVK